MKKYVICCIPDIPEVNRERIAEEFEEFMKNKQKYLYTNCITNVVVLD